MKFQSHMKNTQLSDFWSLSSDKNIIVFGTETDTQNSTKYVQYNS